MGDDLTRAGTALNSVAGTFHWIEVIFMAWHCRMLPGTAESISTARALHSTTWCFSKEPSLKEKARTVALLIKTGCFVTKHDLRWYELVSTRRSIVVLFPIQWGFPYFSTTLHCFELHVIARLCLATSSAA